MRILELPTKLRARGLTVREVGGWENRGNEFPTRPDGALRHWDAAASKHPTASLGVITNGRSDLPGPLAQVYQSRYVDENGLDIVYIVASGKANHAGRGEWNGISGNYNLLGLEIAWSGPEELFDAKRILTSELVMRALLDCCAGTNTDDVGEHREYAQPAGRKIDTNLNGDTLRRRMAELGKPAKPAPVTKAKDRLRPGEKLRPGQSIGSANACYTLVHQVDGNVVLYMGERHRPDTAIWHTHTNNNKTSQFVMQGDGNLVLYSSDGKAIWHTHTEGNPGAYVVMQDDGNLVVYRGSKALWASKGV